MKRIFSLLFCISVLITAHASEAAYTVESIPNPHTTNVLDFVSNPDGILSDETEYYLNQKLNELEKQTTAEVAVVAVNSIGNDDINLFSNKLFAYWGIGKKEKDNGLLVLLVLDQRQIRFETGYGLEGVLPDAICKRIQMQEMIPYLKNNDFNGGMKAGIDKIFLVLTDKKVAAEIYAAANASQKENGLIKFLKFYLVISVIVFFISLLISISTYNKIKTYSSDNYTNYKKSTSFYNSLKIGSFVLPISFLLFFFIWKLYRNKMRTTPIKCSNCGTNMQRLGEKEDDNFLTPKEVAEENVGSIDYDVWLCPSCQEKKVLPYDSSFTKYKECPKCHAKTYSQIGDRIIVHATTFNSGIGEKIYGCEYCHCQISTQYHIPMIVVASGGGSRGGGGGGISGGSFGGGMSGGGGSTSGF